MSTHIWLYLSAALVLEVCGTILIKISDGFTRPGPTVLLVICVTGMFYILSNIVREIELGLTYAIWAGLGTMLVAIVSAIFFKEPMTWVKAISIGLIILGVIGLNSQGGTH